MNKSKLILILIIAFALIIRVWRIDSVPPALFGDELDVGYHAYSILHTGKDYSGNVMPMHFRSLAEWRTPLYLYSAVPTVAIFGISPLGVRLPAVLFGVLGVWLMYLITYEITKKQSLALLSAFLIASLPWHIHYSRAGFEVTEMLTLYMAGIYFFLKGLQHSKFFIFSAFCLAWTPWVYSTAKLFLPITLFLLVLIWFKDLRKIEPKNLIISVVVFSVIVLPFAWNTLFGGGTERFNTISIFNNPELIPQLGELRVRDAQMRDSSATIGAEAKLPDRVFHNQYDSLFFTFTDNYFKSFSTEFLFLKGDPNPRHSIQQGELYKFEFIFLIMGIFFFFKDPNNRKMKLFIIFWLLTAPISSALTKDGGNQSTRLFFMIPPLVLLITYGMYYSYISLKYIQARIFLVITGIVFLLSFLFYLHNYWVHYSWDSERWWQGGFEQAIKETVKEGKNYDKVIISNANEPALIFFLAWSQYSSEQFQKNYPLQETELDKLGKVQKLDKYYFPPIGSGISLYELSGRMPDNSLYLATFKEIQLDLIREPERVPDNLELIKSFAYPSGAPAFYLFKKKSE